MGFLDRFRRKALIASPQILEAARDRTLSLAVPLGVSSQVRNAWLQFQSASYGYLYGHQPAVRKVVDYIATNGAQLGPKLYERVSETEREERGDAEPATVLRDPNPWTPGKQFTYEVFADYLVYNNAYILKVKPDANSRVYLLTVPPPNVAVLGTGVSQIGGYRIMRIDGTNFTVRPEEMIHWRGYDASDRRMGISKLETLRADLSEQAATQRATVDLMESGLQQRGYIKRPLEAADWHTDGGRERFIEQFRAAMQRADRGYPILEEGMEIAPLGVSPKDAEMLESRKLFGDEVAQQYGMVHCPPQDEDERRNFYADVLPPLCSAYCDFLRLSFLQEEYLLDDHYFEFDLDEKRMSDDRLRALTSAAGGPIMTRNEARAVLDKPPLDSSDVEGKNIPPEDLLIVPKNVTEGGKPSVDVMPIQDPNKPPQDGSFRDGSRDEPVEATRGLLNSGKERELVNRVLKFYKRQERVITSRGSGKFDQSRWDRELAADLRAVFDNLDDDSIQDIAREINDTTKKALAGQRPADAFAQLRFDATRWASDIDRARVMLVAASLRDAGESG